MIGEILWEIVLEAVFKLILHFLRPLKLPRGLKYTMAILFLMVFIISLSAFIGILAQAITRRKSLGYYVFGAVILALLVVLLGNKNLIKLKIK